MCSSGSSVLNLLFARALSWPQVISVEPPNFVELEVVDTPPGVKGNTASGEQGSSSSSTSMQQQHQHAASSVRGCVPSQIAEAASNMRAASYAADLCRCCKFGFVSQIMLDNVLTQTVALHVAQM
jgi:hypothetical protein